MERESGSDTLVLKPKNTIRPITGKVCMHVLGTARTDVRVMREATTLVQAGMQVAVVDIESDYTRPSAEIIDGIHMRHIVMPSWFIPARFKLWFLVKILLVLVRGTLLMLKVPTDIYHAHDDTALPACYIAARLLRKPLIFDAHELPLVEPNVTRWGWLHTLSVTLLKKIMTRCVGVITVSPPIVQALRRRYGGRTATLIRNIPAYTAPMMSNRLRAYLGLNDNVCIALYQGNLDSRGLDTLIPAARFMDANIVIVMMGTGSIQAQLEAQIIRAGVSDRVKIIPPVPYAELLSWTASADIGLVVYAPSHAATMTPNIQLCLPNKLFEYLMAGLPVLASPLDAVAEILQTYDVGHVVPSLEPQQVGQAISAMMADRDNLARWRRNAREAVQRDLCWEEEQQHLLDFYRTLLEK